MQELGNDSSGYVRGVELLFAHLDDAESAAAVKPLGAYPYGRQPVSLPPDWPRQPPTLEKPEDLRAAYEWFQAERLRLEDYTAGQFEVMRQQHYEVLAKHYQNEADIARRVQEVNREIQLLSAQAEAMKERARGLAEWEAALAAQTEKLANLQETRAADRKDGADAAERERLAALNALREATSQRQLSEAAARAKLEATQALLSERQAIWEKKQAEFLARQEQFERRCRDLERSEEALRRRSAEIDEVEERLLRAFEEREAEAARAKPRSGPPTIPTPPRPRALPTARSPRR